MPIPKTFHLGTRIDPTDPAQSETSEPLGRAEGTGPLARVRTTAEDVLSAAKSVFHVVLPK